MTGDAGSSLSRRKPRMDGAGIMKAKTADAKKSRKYLLPTAILLVFEMAAVTLWLTRKNLFYLFNFSYIGISVSLGIFLIIEKYRYARRSSQLLVGLYMLVYLGFISGENMQIEGLDRKSVV